MSQPTRILIVDDSALYRQTLQNTLRDLEHVEVVGIARNGQEALAKIEQLDPDLLTLDVQMPDMNGIEVLREIKQRKLRPKAVMVSSFTCEGAQITTDALLEGALDFILKPTGSGAEANRQRLHDELVHKIDAFRQHNNRRRRPEQSESTNTNDVPEPKNDCRAILIGISTGGPAALKVVLPKLPASLSVPVLIVQHMAAQFTHSLAKRLNEICEVEVVEATDSMDVTPGGVFIAPGGHHMKLRRQDEQVLIQITDDPPENNCRPAVDYLFRSAADVLKGHALAVIMTGMGRDGQMGCQHLKKRGGYVFARDEDGCVVYGMPKAVIEMGLADRVLTLGKIAPAIVRHVSKSRRS